MRPRSSFSEVEKPSVIRGNSYKSSVFDDKTEEEKMLVEEEKKREERAARVKAARARGIAVF